jgi:hypothetical protein
MLRGPSKRCGVEQEAGLHGERLVHLNAATRSQDRTSLGIRGGYFEGFGVDDRVTAQLGGSAIAGTTVGDR